jgi:DNA-binding MarR family transcriptional regulator
VDRAAQRDLKILSEIEAGGDVTQRNLAKSLDIALGLTNLYLKRLVRKGYVKITTIPHNRIKYLLTPKGLAEKTRLTYEFVEYSLRLFRDTRARLRAELALPARNGHRRVALYGTGEAAELAFLTIRELGLDLRAVVDDSRAADFLGQAVRSPDSLRPDEVDVVVVATFSPPEAMVRTLSEQGFSPAKILALRRP